MASNSLNIVLKSLTRVGRAQPVHEVASADRINAIQDAIRLLIRGENIVAGNNVLKKSSDGYVVLTGNPAGRVIPSAVTIATPFQVLFSSYQSGEDTIEQVGVTNNSHLFNSEDGDTHEEENEDWGLLGDDTDPFGSNWLDVDFLFPGAKIWLRIALDPVDQSITAIQVKNGAVGGADWPYYPDPIEIDDTGFGPFQKYYHQIIAEVTLYEEDPRPTSITWTPDDFTFYQITQLLTTNLMMTTGHTTSDADDPDVPLIVAIPWNGPGTSTDGMANEINSEDNLMTPWQLGALPDASHYSFQLENASEGDDAKVRIMDGEVNGEVPDGMGTDDYVIDTHDGGKVTLIITYDNNTLEITSKTFAVYDEIPDAELGVFYIEIGATFVDHDESGHIKEFTTVNTQCGDINFNMIYGAFNGNPAIVPVNIFGDWVSLV
jgi:hypothetical protein